MKARKTRKNRFNDILEFPKEIGSNQPRITMSGFNRLLIENYKGILEYEEFYIKVKTAIGNINISGFNLGLEQVTQDDISVKGKIEGIDIDRIVEE